MEALDIRRKLHQFIDSIEDKKAAAIYTLLEGEIDTDAQRKRLVQAEREQYLRGDGSSYSWDDVKEMALHKEKRHAL
ncbi:MAG: hypothetical protein ACTHLB_06220 [Parafilimonas sp.]